MRRTLILFPHEFGGLPVFGFGWVLGLMALAAVIISLVLSQRGQSLSSFWKSNGLIWAIAAAVVVLVIPNVELRSITDKPVGLAVRGYGVMLLLGVVASVWLALLRAPGYGVPADVVYGIAPWLLIGGIAGARLFYIIEYHDVFFTGELSSTIRNMLNFTQGGLVVYGSFIGGFLATVAYVWIHKLSFLRLADVIAPCLFIGLCLGRLGCLMNGCCYGNACEPHWTALRFPNGSPVYEEQMSTGELAGLELDSSRVQVKKVSPGSVADQIGIKAGDAVTKLGTVRSVEEAKADVPSEDVPMGLIAVINGQEHYWPASQLPSVANPVRPSQLISSAGGLALCLSLCLFSRFVTTDGTVLCVAFASYAVLRFGMEMLRNDEPGQFGTELTIAQWVSIVVFTLSCGGLLWLRLRGSSHAPQSSPRIANS